jgi:nucleoside-diphosphate-sugar epimerase
MKVLVTGGSGVVGKAAVAALVAAEHEVRLLTRNAEEAASVWPERVEPWGADVSDRESISGAADGCDAVVHIAGIASEDPPERTFRRMNIEATQHVVDEAARSGVRRVVFVSSLGADRGTSDYHASKRAAEEIVRTFPREWVVLRPGNVYGPGDEVISLLLKMVRALPAIPLIGKGDDPFQPVWHEDLARAIAQSVSMEGIAGSTFDIAGEEVTSSKEIVEKLAVITERRVVTLPVPATMAGLAARAGMVLGVDFPIDDNKLTMLREENVDRSGTSALRETFGVDPVPLDEGLRRLSVALPQQTPDEGSGPLHRKSFSAAIEGSRFSAKELLDEFAERINDVMPLDFAAEEAGAREVVEGAVLTAALPMRGNIAMRVEKRSPSRIILSTLEGHPLAGIVRFAAEPAGDRVRFSVTTFARAADFLDRIAMRTVGDTMQDSNWRTVVENVVEMSGGSAPDGVEETQEEIPGRDAERVNEWIEQLIVDREREENAQA